MNNMRRGFTMIELIFVIVIIGILAAVAIPKLAATRDDARISNIVANTRTALGDITSYYTSQGAAKWNGTASVTAATIADVTNVPLFDTSGCATGTQADASNPAIGTFYICDETAGSDCITITTTATDVNVTATTGTTICTPVQADPAILGIAGGTSGTPKQTKLGGAGVVR